MSYLYLVQISVPKELEAEFNRVYDEQHVPNLRTVKGVRDIQRYKLEWGDEGMPEYLAVYELDDPKLPKTAAWKAESEKGDWPEKIRPNLTVRVRGVFGPR